MSTSPLRTELVAGLFDDAAVFPPGNLPLAEAVPAHFHHAAAAHRDLVSHLVVAYKDLQALEHVLANEAEDRMLEIAVTVPLHEVAAALEAATQIVQVRLRALEVTLSHRATPAEAMSALRATVACEPQAAIFVEIPRDDRRDEVLNALAGTGYFAKFRTGGVRAELYPDEAELAGSILAAVEAGVPFKATAGLHHALRNTDPATGFEQHGHLNLLAATGKALDGADTSDLANALADRDGERIAADVRALDPSVRQVFRCFGTCSIDEPIEELVQLGLLAPDIAKDLP